MPIDDEVRSRLQAVVANVRLPIDPRCRVLLDALIEVGVEKAQAEEVTDTRIGDAERHLRQLLDDMTQQSRILRFDALHGPTLESALARLGPLWPFS